MTGKEMQKVANEMIEVLRNERILSLSFTDPFAKVEALLEFYTTYKESLERNKERLNNIEVKRRTSFGGNNNSSYEYKSELDKKEDIRESIEHDIERLEFAIALIERGLNVIKFEKHYRIIELRYFEEYKREDIAEMLDIDLSTVDRNKTKLIKRMVMAMFPNEVLNI